MFAHILPEEIERIIWKFYYSKYVVREIYRVKPIWCIPSDELIEMCCDKGCAQLNHTDLERVLLSMELHTPTLYMKNVLKICVKIVYITVFLVRMLVFMGALIPD